MSHTHRRLRRARINARRSHARIYKWTHRETHNAVVLRRPRCTEKNEAISEQLTYVSLPNERNT